MIRSAPRSRQLALDAALTAAVFGFSVAQMATQAFGAKEGQASGGDMVGVAVCLLAALPLLVRHRAPRAALVAVLGGTVALVALDYAVLTAPAPAIVLATLAERDRRRQDALMILIACIAAFAAFVAVAWARFEPEPGEYTITALLWAGGWIVGDRRRLARPRAAQGRGPGAGQRGSGSAPRASSASRSPRSERGSLASCTTRPDTRSPRSSSKPERRVSSRTVSRSAAARRSRPSRRSRARACRTSTRSWADCATARRPTWSRCPASTASPRSSSATRPPAWTSRCATARALSCDCCHRSIAPPIASHRRR